MDHSALTLRSAVTAERASSALTVRRVVLRSSSHTKLASLLLLTAVLLLLSTAVLLLLAAVLLLLLAAV